jgi:mRNA interferase RelE/StbE
MELYTLKFKNSVEKDLRKIPKELLPLIFERIEQLTEEPIPPESH